MSNEMITVLPTVTNAALSDIIYAVQGYSSPSSPGLSVQETLQQVFNLMLSNTVLTYAGNPNGNVAGSSYQLLWDSTDNILWVCVNSGSSSTAIWKTTTPQGIFIWNNVTTASKAMITNNGYIINDSSSLVTLSLPAASNLGDELQIVGRSSSGWTVTQGTGQQIIIGSSSSTSGVGGSISSTNAHDSIYLVCTNANLEWTAGVGPQGNITIV